MKKAIAIAVLVLLSAVGVIAGVCKGSMPCAYGDGETAHFVRAEFHGKEVVGIYEHTTKDGTVHTSYSGCSN